MKKLLALVIAAVCVLSVNTMAHAFPYVGGADNGLFFNNAEVLIERGSVDGVIAVGDTFWGTFQMNQIKGPATNAGQIGPSIWFPGQNPMEVTGYFATDVVQIIPAGTNPGQLTDILVLGPAASDPNGVLGAGEVLRLYEDNAIDYLDTTQVSALSTATDGILHSAWGFGQTGYWYSFAPAVIPAGGAIGVSYAGLNLVSSAYLPPLLQVNDPNEFVRNTDVDLYLNSEIFNLFTYGTPAGRDQMHFGSNDPAVFHPTPEPATMVMFGLGLAGLAGLRKKK